MDQEVADDPVNGQKIVRNNVYMMLFIENFIITLSVVYFFICFRTSKPPTPPSFAAMRNHESITQGLVKDMKNLLKNCNYLLVAAVFTMMYGVYAGFQILIASILAPYGYTTL